MAQLTAGLKLVRISKVTHVYISCRFIPFQGFARSHEILGTEPVRGGDEKIGGTGKSYSPIASILYSSHSGPKWHAVLPDCRNIQAGIFKKS